MSDVMRWKVMSPELKYHPNYPYIEVVPSADYDALRSRLAAAEADADTLLGMIRHQRDVLRECLPYLNESMAGRRPGRSADDIRAAVKALTADQPTVSKP